VRTKVSNLESVSARDMSERMQQLLWFNNKLQLSLRRLYSLQRQKNILKHKVLAECRALYTRYSAQPAGLRLSSLACGCCQHNLAKCYTMCWH